MITIDHNKCNQDYLCESVCPYGFLFARDEKGYPGVAPEAFKKYCIRCWHCIAICPKGAISYPGIERETLEKVKKESLLTTDLATGFIRSRRSCRLFKPESVPETVISDWMEITRWTPTASNSQQLSWILVSGQDKVGLLAAVMQDWLNETGSHAAIREQWQKGRDILLRHAPHLAIVTLPKDYYWAMSDGATALSYLELTARSFGLATCWAGFFTRAAGEFAPLQQAIRLPATHQVAGALMFGYPGYRFSRVPKRKPLKIRVL